MGLLEIYNEFSAGSYWVKVMLTISEEVAATFREIRASNNVLY